MVRSTARMDELEARAWRDMATVLELLPAALDAQLQRDAGITHFEFVVLSALRLEARPTMRVKELAAFAHATLPRLSHVLSRLEARGLVERSPCPEDRRATNVALTTEGRRVLIHALPGHFEAVHALLLEPVGREGLAAFAAGLERIAAGLDADDRFLRVGAAERASAAPAD